MGGSAYPDQTALSRARDDTVEPEEAVEANTMVLHAPGKRHWLRRRWARLFKACQRRRVLPWLQAVVARARERARAEAMARARGGVWGLRRRSQLAPATLSGLWKT